MGQIVVEPKMENYLDEDGALDIEGFIEANSKWNAIKKAERLESRILMDYGISKEDWDNTPQNLKIIISDLYSEIEQFQESFHALEQWRDEMPI